MPCLRIVSAMCATEMWIQYITRVGPGPKLRRDKMTNTSPIDITEEILGNRTLIVATNAETNVRATHSELNCPGWMRQ